MHVELTEQQARCVAEAARVGLGISDATPLTSPGEVAAAYKAIEVLFEAVAEALGRSR